VPDEKVIAVTDRAGLDVAGETAEVHGTDRDAVVAKLDEEARITASVCQRLSVSGVMFKGRLTSRMSALCKAVTS